MLEAEIPNKVPSEVVTLFKSAVNGMKALELDEENLQKLTGSLKESGINFGIADEAKRRLWQEKKEEKETLDVQARQFRARVILNENNVVVETEFYDRQKSEGERWTNLDELDENNTEVILEKTDRMAGMLLILGKEKFKKLVKWTYKSSKKKGYPDRLKNKNTGEPRENTRGRGLLQAAADLLGLALLDPGDEGFEEKKERLVDDLNKRLYKGFLKVNNDNDKIEQIENNFGDIEKSKEIASFHPDLLPELVEFLLSI